jgi:HlyD family secretion protein
MTQLGAPTQERSRPPEKPKPKRKPSQLLFISLLIVGGGLSWYFLLHPKLLSNLGILQLSSQRDKGALELSGRIEGYETNVGAKTAGRVDYVAVREGDQVHKGQVIARLDDSEIQAQLRGATAQITAAQQRASQTGLGIAVIESQIKEGQLNQQQAKGNAQGTIYQAQANLAQSQAQLAQAEAQVKQAQADLKLAKVNRDRYAQLVSEGAETQLQADQAEATFDSDQATLAAREAAVNAAQKQVSAAQGALQQAQSTGLNPNIKNAQIETLRQQLIQTTAQYKATQADVANAIAARQQIAAQIGYLNVVSPIDGVVTSRDVEPGAVVTEGKTLLTVINPNTVYLRGYIPESSIGKARVGQRAKVFLDSAPDKPLLARVTAIDTEASFTPENIYFRNDRVKQVFGVKIGIDNPAGFAKPGMPADAEIIIKPEPSK